MQVARASRRGIRLGAAGQEKDAMCQRGGSSCRTGVVEGFEAKARTLVFVSRITGMVGRT